MNLLDSLNPKKMHRISRQTGFNLGSSYSVIYGYDSNTGRFRPVQWSAGSQTHTASYSYLPDSDLLERVTTTGGLSEFTASYTYEPYRNLREQVKNTYGPGTISQYDYTYNTIGLRDDVTIVGTLNVLGGGGATSSTAARTT